MTALERYEAPTTAPSKWVDLVTPAADLAQRIANTDFVPAAMHGKAPVVAACIMFGDELGIGPMQSLAKIDVIDGRPAPKAELARALVYAAGHDMWVEESTNTKCTIGGRRRGSDKTMTVTWTMDDAKRAGLDGKQNWRKWPRAMLLARASAELARAAFPDCLGGIGLFLEEAEDDTQTAPAPAPVPVAATTAPKSTRTRKLEVAPPAEIAAAPDDLPPLPDELDQDPPSEALFDEINGTGPKLITDPQLKKLATMFGKLGITTRDDRITFCRLVTGRTLVSSKDMTIEEASRVIDRLGDVEADRAGFILDATTGALIDIAEEVGAA